MKILRDGKIYEVVDEQDGEYAVMVEFDFAEPPHKRKLKIWGNTKENCEIIEA